MPTLTLNGHTTAVEPALTLFEHAERLGVRVPTSCRKQGKCKAEASAHAKANDVEDSDHDLKVVEGDGCSAKAESKATVKPQKQQSE